MSTSASTVTRTKPTNAPDSGSSGNGKVGLSLATSKQGNDRVLISKVHANSLFAGSGIQAGQELVTVNGVTVKELPIQSVVQLLQKEATLTLVVVSIPSISNASSYEDEDIDACQLGHFLVNPCWFLYLKLKRLLGKTRQPAGDSLVEKTRWMGNLQQILYLSSFYSTWWVILTKGIPLNQATHHISSLHEVCCWFIFALAVLSWIVAKNTSPGSITSKTIPKFDNYSYDGVLYTNSVCPTLNIRKLARSKYDRYTQKHVPRFDHHCGWLGNTIGEENYRLFLLFVGIHTLMMVYGSALGGYLLFCEAQQDGSWTRAVSLHPGIAAASSFGFLASFPITTFFFFHLSLVRVGMTTNEFYKWKQIAKNNDKGGVDIELASSSCCAVPPAGRQFYNLGILGNLHEVCFPRSLRLQVRMGYKES